MNRAVTDPVLWTRSRWWVAFAVVMAAQVALMFTLSERKLIVPRQADNSTAFYLVADVPTNSVVSALVDVSDPTLFALPDRRGLSGGAWLRAPSLQYHSADWTEPSQWLTLPATELGAAFLELVRTNVVARRSAAAKLPARLSEVAVSPVPLPAKSRFHVEGDLSKRELLALWDVPSIAHIDLLTNTVVQVGVSPSGFALSAIVLSGSGSKAADQRALELTRSLHFKPIAEREGISLTWGKIVFQWHTLEMSVTNATPANPSL